MRFIFSFSFLLSITSALAVPPINPNIGHNHHHHRHGKKHETVAPTPARFVTSRRSSVELPLPNEKDAFTFIVYGDANILVHMVAKLSFTRDASR